MRLKWTPCVSASAIHATHCLAQGMALSDPDLENGLRHSAERLKEMAVRSDPQRFWTALLAGSASIAQNRPLAEFVFREAVIPFERADSEFSETSIAELSGVITEVEAAFLSHFPKIEQQLPLRAGPLRDLWTGFGSGLAAHVKRLTQAQIVFGAAESVLVQPVCNGGGWPLMGRNAMVMEAVLANPEPELPEVLRVAWLLCQVAWDAGQRAAQREKAQQERAHPENSDQVESQSSRQPFRFPSEVERLAFIAVVLAAGQVVELCKMQEETVALALKHWLKPARFHPDTAVMMVGWWETYLQTKAEWRIAIQALEKLVYPKP